MMLATLLARVRPASTRANPACMKITSTAAIKTQMLSSTVCTASAVSGASASWATAGVASASNASPPTPRPMVSFLRMSLLSFVLTVGPPGWKAELPCLLATDTPLTDAPAARSCSPPERPGAL